ncbi:MAG TPA: hypothetical protein VMV71_03905 [Candidatus Paceibacterota bacterium]|nr:hypothetical protein [Candidatus Paceibacterota bacterium]
MFGFIKKILPEKLNAKRVFLILCFAVLTLSVPATTHAAGVVTAVAGTIFGGVLAVAIGGPVLVLNYILAFILGLAVPVISYFIGVVLQLNMNIIKSNMVGSGFTITLSLANLGFVLAIIIIAIATILRYQSYALKQTLWKLVMAAVLVNFSLVIAGAILTFSNTLSLYFLDSINPSGGGSSYENFVGTMINSFGPQRMFLAGSNYSAATSGNIGTTDVLAGIGNSFGSALVFIANLFFPTIFLAVMDIALVGFFIMLLIRYVYLGILLIIMPMAWLLWIFPLTSGQWQKWWHKFIQWTMFAPIVLFFIWLAILTMGGSDPNNIQGISFIAPASILQSVSQITGNILSGLLGPLLQMTMMIAMLFAGLFMAQSMGITFAGATIKGASWVTSGIGRGVGGFAKRRGLIAGGAVMRRPGIQKLAEKSRQYGADRGVFGRVASLPSRLAGRAIEATTVATTENLVKDAEKRLGDQTKEQLVHGIGSTFTSPEKIAAMKILGKGGSLDMAKMSETHAKETKELFGTYKQAIDYEKTIEKKSGVSSEMYEAIKNGDPKERIDELAVEFAKKFSRAEVAEMQASDLFSNVPAGKEKFGLDDANLRKVSDSVAYGFAVAAPQFAPAILSKLKSQSLDNFSNDYKNGLTRGIRTGDIPTVAEGIDRLKKFNTSLLNNTMGFVTTEAPAAPAAAPTPTPPTP